MKIDQAGGNPFSTRRIKPGAIPFLLPPSIEVATLGDLWVKAGRRGQIVGQHGTGKSTLLASLLAVLQDRGEQVIAVALHDGQRTLPVAVWRTLRYRTGQPLLLAIDGMEQLTRWERFRIRRCCRRLRIGLLVTAHSSVRLPTIWTTKVDARLAKQVVARLDPASLIDTSDFDQLLFRHQGNLRDLLFDLYDRFEAARRTAMKNRTL